MTGTTARRRVPTVVFTVAALALALVVACVVSVAASSSPDGLEYVAESAGFHDRATDSATAGSPLADYGAGLFDGGWPSLAVAGAVGCALTFGLAMLVGIVAKRRRREETADAVNP